MDIDNESEDDEFTTDLIELANQIESEMDDDDKILQMEWISNETAYLKCLAEKFGYGEFRPKQLDIIHSIVECRRDVFAAMPTGYGQS